MPPYTKVKRIPRDYTNEEQIVLKYKQQREKEDNRAQKATVTSQASASKPTETQGTVENGGSNVASIFGVAKGSAPEKQDN